MRVTWRPYGAGTLVAGRTRKGRNCAKTVTKRMGLTAQETLSSEEKLLTTMRHISRVRVPAEQRRANEIGTRNQNAGRTRSEVEIHRLWRSGHVIVTGAVPTLYHVSPLSGSMSVGDSTNARQIGVCRPPGGSNGNRLCHQLFTSLTYAKVRHYPAGQPSVRTLHHGNLLSERARLDPGYILGVAIRHLRRGHLSGHHHPSIPRPAHGDVIVSHPPMGCRLRDGDVALSTRRQRTSTPVHPSRVATRRPRSRVALRRENPRVLKVTHRTPCYHLRHHTQRTARRSRNGIAADTGAISRCTPSCKMSAKRSRTRSTTQVARAACAAIGTSR